MSIRKPHIHDQGRYFITFTNTHWLPLIQLTNAYDLVYNWFDYLKEHNLLVLSEQTLGMTFTILHEYGHHGDQIVYFGGMEPMFSVDTGPAFSEDTGPLSKCNYS